MTLSNCTWPIIRNVSIEIPKIEKKEHRNENLDQSQRNKLNSVLFNKHISSADKLLECLKILNIIDENLFFKDNQSLWPSFDLAEHTKEILKKKLQGEFAWYNLKTNQQELYKLEPSLEDFITYLECFLSFFYKRQDNTTPITQLIQTGSSVFFYLGPEWLKEALKIHVSHPKLNRLVDRIVDDLFFEMNDIDIFINAHGVLPNHTNISMYGFSDLGDIGAEFFIYFHIINLKLIVKENVRTLHFESIWEFINYINILKNPSRIHQITLESSTIPWVNNKTITRIDEMYHTIKANFGVAEFQWSYPFIKKIILLACDYIFEIDYHEMLSLHVKPKAFKISHSKISHSLKFHRFLCNVSDNIPIDITVTLQASGKTSLVEAQNVKIDISHFFGINQPSSILGSPTALLHFCTKKLFFCNLENADKRNLFFYWWQVAKGWEIINSQALIIFREKFLNFANNQNAVQSFTSQLISWLNAKSSVIDPNLAFTFFFNPLTFASKDFPKVFLDDDIKEIWNYFLDYTKKISDPDIRTLSEFTLKFGHPLSVAVLVILAYEYLYADEDEQKHVRFKVLTSVLNHDILKIRIGDNYFQLPIELPGAFKTLLASCVEYPLLAKFINSFKVPFNYKFKTTCFHLSQLFNLKGVECLKIIEDCLASSNLLFKKLGFSFLLRSLFFKSEAKLWMLLFTYLPHILKNEEKSTWFVIFEIFNQDITLDYPFKEEEKNNLVSSIKSLNYPLNSENYYLILLMTECFPLQKLALNFFSSTHEENNPDTILKIAKYDTSLALKLVNNNNIKLLLDLGKAIYNKNDNSDLINDCYVWMKLISPWISTKYNQNIKNFFISVFKNYANSQKKLTIEYFFSAASEIVENKEFLAEILLAHSLGIQQHSDMAICNAICYKDLVISLLNTNTKKTLKLASQLVFLLPIKENIDLWINLIDVVNNTTWFEIKEFIWCKFKTITIFEKNIPLTKIYMLEKNILSLAFFIRSDNKKLNQEIIERINSYKICKKESFLYKIIHSVLQITENYKNLAWIVEPILEYRKQLKSYLINHQEKQETFDLLLIKLLINTESKMYFNYSFNYIDFTTIHKKNYFDDLSLMIINIGINFQEDEEILNNIKKLVARLNSCKYFSLLHASQLLNYNSPLLWNYAVPWIEKIKYLSELEFLNITKQLINNADHPQCLKAALNLIGRSKESTPSVEIQIAAIEYFFTSKQGLLQISDRLYSFFDKLKKEHFHEHLLINTNEVNFVKLPAGPHKVTNVESLATACMQAWINYLQFFDKKTIILEFDHLVKSLEAVKNDILFNCTCFELEINFNENTIIRLFEIKPEKESQEILIMFFIWFVFNNDLNIYKDTFILKKFLFNEWHFKQTKKHHTYLLKILCKNPNFEHIDQEIRAKVALITGLPIDSKITKHSQLLFYQKYFEESFCKITNRQEASNFIKIHGTKIIQLSHEIAARLYDNLIEKNSKNICVFEITFTYLEDLLSKLPDNLLEKKIKLWEKQVLFSLKNLKAYETQVFESKELFLKIINFALMPLNENWSTKYKTFFQSYIDKFADWVPGWFESMLYPSLQATGIQESLKNLSRAVIALQALSDKFRNKLTPPWQDALHKSWLARAFFLESYIKQIAIHDEYCEKLLVNHVFTTLLTWPIAELNAKNYATFKIHFNNWTPFFCTHIKKQSFEVKFYLIDGIFSALTADLKQNTHLHSYTERIELLLDWLAALYELHDAYVDIAMKVFFNDQFLKNNFQNQLKIKNQIKKYLRLVHPLSYLQFFALSFLYNILRLFSKK